MLASRAMKPKLSLSIAPVPQPTTTTTAKRPMLSLAIKTCSTPTGITPLRSPMTPTAMTPMAPTKSPLSPLPQSPTARNTKINARGYSTIAQQPTYTYTNNASSRSILKKSQSNTSARRVAQLQFSEDPVVYCVSPIEDPDYYGGYKKMTREERRWTVRT